MQSTAPLPLAQFTADVRPVGAPLELKSPGSAKDVFMDARSSYSYNRVRALMSSTALY